MLANVFTKTLRERGLSSVILGVGFGVLCLVTLPAVAGDLGQQLTSFTANMPEALAGLVGVSTGASGTQYVLGELFNLMLPVGVLALAIVVGSSAVASEEEAGTLELLLANPVSRTRVVVAKTGVLVVGLLTVGLLVWTGLQSAELVAADVEIAAGTSAAAIAHLLMLALAFGLFAMALGTVTGQRTLAGGVAGALALVFYLVGSLLPIIDGLDWTAKATPFYLYNGSEPLSNGVEPLHLGLLAVIAVVCLAGAIVGVRRRDFAS
jgi:ABC-2 type transport system permease protein